MAIDLPQTGTVFLPTIPKSVKTLSPELADYLIKLHTVIQSMNKGGFSNDLNIANVIGSGASGTFAIASGGHILVTSGIVISVSTT